MADCNGQCSSCSKDCSERDLKLKQNSFSNIKKIYAVVSGKGGVGKSSVTALLASKAAKEGKSVAILDADVTGPSIPKMFGLNSRAATADGLLVPELAENGVRVMSVNLLLDSEDSPVVWRGPVISGVIQQFFTDVAWGDVDCLFVDMPPGTGDASLTVFQSLPIDGIIVVTTPQSLVSMIVAKAVNMAKLMDIPIIGLIENMSYFECPDCGGKHFLFGASKAEEVASRYGLKLLARLPIDGRNALLSDSGRIFESDALDDIDIDLS